MFGGYPEFEFEREIRFGEDTTAADQIIIPVGGRAPGPRIPGLERDPYPMSSSVMEAAVVIRMNAANPRKP